MVLSPSLMDLRQARNSLPLPGGGLLAGGTEATVVVANFSVDLLPGLLQSEVPGGFTKSDPQRGGVYQTLEAVGEGFGVSRLGQQAAFPIHDLVGGTGNGKPHRSQAGSHGLEHDVAEGLGEGRKRENIGRRIQICQFLAPAKAGENSSGYLFPFQDATQRPIADH
jgi:hypothetical protein